MKKSFIGGRSSDVTVRLVHVERSGAAGTLTSKIIPMNLSFFEGEKTEKATPRKKQKAREKGQVAKSAEVTTAVLFLAVFSVLKLMAPYMANHILGIFHANMALVGDIDNIFTPAFLHAYIANLFTRVLLIVAPVFGTALLFGLIANFAQVGWHPTTQPLMPKFSRLNPISGVKRLFSFHALVDLVKSLLKFSIIGYAIYTSVKKQINVIPLLAEMPLMEAVAYIGNVCVNMGIMVGGLFILVAALDYAYTRFKHTRELRMTKQEVKEEYKSVEGNPLIKGKIRSKMREASMRRMMQEVPRADVIITNPTHFAVALQYDRQKGAVPRVIAKGMDFLALRIKEKAREAGVEIVENKQLARSLYQTVDVGREIPPELYQTVAEILAFVYKLKNKENAG